MVAQEHTASHKEGPSTDPNASGAQDPEHEVAQEGDHENDGGDGHGRGGGKRGGLTRLIAAVTRLVDLQYRIWLTQLKLVMMRVAVSTGLLLGSAVLGILSVIFLCIGVFHVLLEVVGLPPWAAFLIFGGGLGLVAFILVMIAVRLLTRTEAQDDAKAEKENAT